jgi:hypothetical protein
MGTEYCVTVLGYTSRFRSPIDPFRGKTLGFTNPEESSDPNPSAGTSTSAVRGGGAIPHRPVRRVIVVGIADGQIDQFPGADRRHDAAFLLGQMLVADHGSLPTHRSSGKCAQPAPLTERCGGQIAEAERLRENANTESTSGANPSTDGEP